MRPATEIGEVPLPVNSNLLVLKVVDQLQFIGLGMEYGACRRLRHLFFSKGEIGSDGFPHLFLDDAEVVGSEGTGEFEIIIEAIFGRRPDAELDVRKERLHCLSHNMGRRVTHRLQSLCFLLLLHYLISRTNDTSSPHLIMARGCRLCQMKALSISLMYLRRRVNRHRANLL